MKVSPLYRTIRSCIKEIKKQDPDTALTEYALRTFVREDKVKHLDSGSRVLVNYDDLLRYLEIGESEPKKETKSNNENDKNDDEEVLP